MNLTKFSDYSLRVLIYLALHPERPVTVAEISKAYNVSQHHLVKVSQLLIDKGYVTSLRGRSGGLRLSRQPGDINIGKIVRLTEPNWNVVECFDSATNSCPIDGACGLKGALRDAQQAFLNTLEAHTIADFLPQSKSILQLLRSASSEQPSL
jgi:Rrf2 family nitric oxide-sensitive transcriptional repressor